MRAWLLRGYKPINVAGMLEWLRDGMPVQGGNGQARAAPTTNEPKSWGALRRYAEKEGLTLGEQDRGS